MHERYDIIIEDDIEMHIFFDVHIYCFTPRNILLVLLFLISLVSFIAYENKEQKIISLLRIVYNWVSKFNYMN